MIRLLTFATAVALAAHAAPANAGTPDGVSIEVKAGDLDLSAPEGRAALDRRIDRAARQVCAAEDVRNLRQMMAAKACYRVALASAQPQLAALISKRTRAAA